jgi:uncharacterized protein with HEPN domain
MLAAMNRIAELTGRIGRAQFESDWVLQNAVIRELEILGEAAGRVSKQFVAVHDEIPWKEITGLRHKLIHDYFEVDAAIVWTTATVNVPRVLPAVREAAEALSDDSVADGLD